MSDLSDSKCPTCGVPLERVRYFPRQLLTADDLRLDQEYARQSMRRHQLFLHGWGVVCGCRVEAAPAPGQPLRVRVCPGYAVGPQGDGILIDDCVLFDLERGLPVPDPCAVRWPCPPVGEMPSHGRENNRVYLAVRYAECYSRPVRVPPAGCACDETLCEYSRIRDSFELKALWQLPESHVKAREADQAWCAEFRTFLEEKGSEFPLPPCPECTRDPWVVLATIRLPEKGTAVQSGDISHRDRRPLPSTDTLRVALGCA